MPQEHLPWLTFVPLPINENSHQQLVLETYFCQGFARTFHRIWSPVVLTGSQPIFPDKNNQHKHGTMHLQKL